MTSVLNPATSKRIRSLRMRNGRSGSSIKSDQEDSVPLDLTRDPNDILKEILRNICGQQSVSTPRKLGHLNNFVKLLCNISDSSLITIPMEVIMTCLKGALVSDVKEVRAAAVRVLRYLINDDATKRTFIDLNVDFLITRCLDISHFNEVERIQAVRLARKIAHIKRKKKDDDCDPIVPLPLMACIVSISLDGAAERDRVYRTCLAVLCELALLQPWLVVRSNGVLALVNAILECHMYHRINESLCLSLMHIVNHPGLRKWHQPVLDVSPTFAPYTELNYRLHPDVEDSILHEELEMRFMASKMAIVSLLRTWTGLLHICHSKDMISSFVDALSIPNEAVRRGILTVLAELFYFNELVWTDNFQKALNAAAPGHFRDNWKISEGFVVAEGKCLLPVRYVSRPDLVDCHLAIVLSSFLQSGLLEALTKVAISTESCSSVCSTLLLGLLLHLATRLLPSDNESSSWQRHLPQLLKSNNSVFSVEESLRINLTVKRLQEIYCMKNDAPTPYSVYLSQLMLKKSHMSPAKSSSILSSPRGRSITTTEGDSSSSGTFAALKRNRSLNLIRDFTDDHSLAALKNTKVLASKEHKDWDWDALQYLFLSPQCFSFLKAVGVDDMLRRFYRRLIFFYQPSSRLFCALEQAKDGNPDKNRIFVETAIEMMRNLTYADEEGQRLLKNLILDIVNSLPKINSEAVGFSRVTGSLAVTCSREYFLILSALSCHPKGDLILKQCKAYQYFMGLASKETHDTLVRLLVSSLHYSEHGPARMVLNKVLTTCSEPARLYATGFLRVLLRANYPGFLQWGTEMLTTQLFDSSNDVALEALDILHEACDDRAYLRAVVRLRPTLLHLGDRGAMLVCRFMSVPQGFAYLSHNNYLNRELQRWWTEYNERYVIHVEELLKLSLTSFERPNKEDGFVRRSGNKKTRQSVYLPAHLYGELCRHADGAKLIEKEKIASRITEDLRMLVDKGKAAKKSLKKEVFNKDYDASYLLKMKSCLWALAHIGSTIHGLPLIESTGALPLITSLASSSPVSSIRGTCLYCLSTVAQTVPGVEALQKLGYQCVLKTVCNMQSSEDDDKQLTPPQAIVTPRMIREDRPHKSLSSQVSNTSTSSIGHRKSPFGSLSNISTSSDATQSSSFVGVKSDRLSKISKVSSKYRSRQHSRSSSESKVSPISPYHRAASSTISSPTSVFEFDEPTSRKTYTKASNPSPQRAFTSDSGRPMSNLAHRKHSLPVFSSLDRRPKAMNTSSARSNFHQPKPKLKDRFFDILLRRNRSRSVNYSPRRQAPGSRQSQDDASSGYASDQPFSLDSIKEQQKKQEEGVVRLPTHIDIVQRSRILDSSHVPSTSSASAETLKTTDVAEQRIAKEDSFNGDGTLKDVSSWNTNNSGLIKSNYSDEASKNLLKTLSSNTGTSVDATRTCVLCNKIETFPNQSLLRRASSFPEDIDNYNVFQANSITHTCLKNRHSRTLLLRKHHFKLKRSFSSGQLTDILKLSGGKINLKLLTDFTSTNPSNKTVWDKISPLDGVVPSPIKFIPEVTSEKRDRGNTQTSLDSGVITDVNVTSSPLHDTSCVTVSKQPLPLLSVQNPSKKTENEWRFTGPKGWWTLQILRDDYEQRVPGNKNSNRDRSFSYEDVVLSVEERDYIIENTHYVGIVVPNKLSDLFKPSVGQIPRSVFLNPTTLFRESQEKDKQLEEAELMRERKVSTAHRAPKLRGLDESTFGPEVAVGLSNGKYGRLHSTIMTPCGRTPDSLLSETSDFCYIGGQLVEPGSEEHVALLHEEIILLVTKLASSVGVKGHETSLLLMKEKKPEVFDSILLYNSIVLIMSEHSFRLPSRRFVQELFQDVRFTDVHLEARRALQSLIEK